MASEMELYWGSGSGPCWVAMIMLEEKGLKGYKSHLISFSKKEHKGDDLMKLNPRGQVPTFRHGDIIVNESMGIVDYLQAVYPSQGATLLPTDPAELAQVLQRKYEVPSFKATCIEKYIYLMWHGKLKDLPEEELTKKKEDMLAEIGRWEGYLEKVGDGGHIANKDFTIADVILFPYLAFIVRSGFKLSPRFPRLQAYYNQVKDRPSVNATWPPHWKESPAATHLADV